ncbi:MAG: hypothetical protein WAK16_06510 [Candidatus Cybelea sp.]
MTARKPSPHTRHRHALDLLATLEAHRDKLDRSRPRTPGKKGAKTRALNRLSGQIRAAKGQLTKARNAIAREAATRTAHKDAAKQRRSEAAKKGWAKRRAAQGASGIGDIWQHLLPDGKTTPVTLDPSDSSLEGKYWNAYEDAAGGKRDLREFDGRSVFDLDRQQRFPFVTDLNVIGEHADEIDFGPGFYKRRSDAPGNVA